MLKSKLLKVFASKIRGVLGGGGGCVFVLGYFTDF